MERPEPVKRWDIYDVADELADIPGMIKRVIEGQPKPGEALADIYADLADLENRLWEASRVGGGVGPYPDYTRTA